MSDAAARLVASSRFETIFFRFAFALPVASPFNAAAILAEIRLAALTDGSCCTWA